VDSPASILGADLTRPGGRPAHIAHSPDGDEEKEKKKFRKSAAGLW
jgi:hypothetical protein